jgi:1,2-phenylacetyl-CoA epoxidase catalytic subunit
MFELFMLIGLNLIKLMFFECYHNMVNRTYSVVVCFHFITDRVRQMFKKFQQARSSISPIQSITTRRHRYHGNRGP